jgi:uncharacterized repeat protein (TIGR01451 family)
MSADRTRWRRLGPRRWTTLRVETLEKRCLLTPGIYLENFENDPTNPTGPVDPATAVAGFDAAGDFQHSFSSSLTAQFHRISGTTTPDAMPSLPFDLYLEGTDTITFPHVDVANNEAVVLASVLVGPDIAQSTVKFIGQTDTLTRVFPFGDTWHRVTASAGDIGDGGQPLGPITSIFLDGFDGGEFDNVSIFVQGQGQNPPPTASGAIVSTLPNTALDINVADLGDDQDGDSLAISGVSMGATINGTFVPIAGTVENHRQFITYTPPAGFHGTEVFGYTIDDGHGNTASATVTVHVNTPPTAPNQTFDVPHGTVGAFTVAGPGLRALPMDPDNDPLTITVSDGTLGHVVYDSTSGGFTYTPSGGGLVRSDQFTYTVSDGTASTTGTVFLVPQNQPPPAASDLTEEVAHGMFGSLTFPAPGIMAVNPRTDADGDTLRPVLETDPAFTQPALGHVTLNADGSFTYTRNDQALPDASDAFTYRLFDGYVTGPPATVHIHVPNNPPVLREPTQDLGFTHSQIGQPVPIGNLSDYATDPDGDALRLGTAVVAGGGSVTVDSQGNLTFVPAPGQTTYTQDAGPTMHASVSMTVTDGADSSAPVQITITYPNTPPVAQDLVFDIPVGFSAVGGVVNAHFMLQALAGYGGLLPPYVDPDGDTVHAIAVSNPAHGTMTFEDGDVHYQESRPFVTDSFSFKLTDGYVETSVVTMTLVPQRLAPNLYPDVLAVSPGQQSVAHDILSNDYFADLTSVFGHGQAILVSTDGTFHLYDLSGTELQPGDVLDFKNGFGYGPAANSQSSTHSFTYKVRYDLNDDPSPQTAVTTDTATVEIEVFPQPQSDDDGIPDNVENGAPNGGDGNGDHIPDSQQDNVASLPDSTDGGYVTLASAAGTELVDVAAVRNPSPNDIPPGLDFPLGFFHFRLFGPFFGTVYGQETIQNATFVELYSPIELPPPPDFHYFRYGQTPDNPSDHWYDFTYDGQTGAEFLSTHELRLHFVDGQRGDDDLKANDIIVDDGGPAIMVADLALGQTAAPTKAIVGQDLTFTLTVTNNAPIAAPGVVVTDPLPGGAAFVSATASQGSCVVLGSSVQCTIGTLAPGASATIQVVVRPSGPGTLTNTARVSGSLTDPVAKNDAATAVVQASAPSPLVTVTALGPTKVKVKLGAGKRARTKAETGLLLQFSDALSGTGNPAAYHLLTGTTRKGVTTFRTPVPLAVFSFTPSTVTLLPGRKLKASLPEQLHVVATDLTDALGRPLKGGQSFSVTFGNKTVTSAAPVGR